MWTVQELMESDPFFETKYASRIVLLIKEKLQEWMLKIGSHNLNLREMISNLEIETQFKVLQLKKTVYSFAFDNKYIGLHNNVSQGCSGYIENCVSFNNYINYQLPYVFEKWSSNWSCESN